MATNTQTRMTLQDWLDDLCVRFIINLPNEELSEMPRICFQVEEAQWYYEDFIRPLDSTLPNLQLKEFFQYIFQHCPILSHIGEEIALKAYDQWIVYKKRVPVRGAILLNHRMDKALLVKGWKKAAAWSFPRGKVNKDEDPLECAIRELYEETGFDVRGAGLVPDDPDEVKFIQVMSRDQEIRLYIFHDVPEDFNFAPRTRKEIGDIKWWKLSELPSWKRRGQKDPTETDAAVRANRFYMVAPFLTELRKLVQQRKKEVAKAKTINIQRSEPTIAEEDEGVGLHLQPQEHEQRQQESEQHQVAERAGLKLENDDTAEAMASANVELKRLLNIQGLAPDSSQNQLPGTEAASNKGSALLALLQGGPSGSVPSTSGPSTTSGMFADAQANRPPPQTPMDHTYIEAPEPRSPHHHHTHQPPPSFSTYPPPPSFPYNPSHDQAFASQYYQGQAVPNNPNIQAQVHAHEMPHPGPQQAFLNRHHLRKESVPLVHPQPLPPQVQTGLLTHGLNGTPAVPEARVGPMQPPNQQIMQQQQQPQYQPQATRQIPQQHASPQRTNQQANHPKPHPPNLNSHSLALLNAFKSDAKPPMSSTANAQSTQFQQQQHGMPAPQAAPQQIPHQQYAPEQRQEPPIQNPLAQSSASQAAQPRPTLPAKDAHKSSLLSLFKTKSPAGVGGPTNAPSPGSAGPVASPASVGSQKSGHRPPPQRRVSGAQAYGQVENQGNGVSLLGHDAQRTGNANISQTDALRAAAKENGGPVQMHPEANLPFRAVGILARPKHTGNSPGAASNTSFPSPKAPSRAVGSPLSNQIGRMGLGSPRGSSPKNIQLKKRPESLSKPLSGQGTSSQPRYMQQPPIGSPYGSYAGSHTGDSNRMGGYASPPVGGSFAGAGGPATTNPSHPVSAGLNAQPPSTDHKQSLLALFGRGGGGGDAGGSSSVGPGDAGSMSGTPRSHVLSVASGHFGAGGSSHAGAPSAGGPGGPGSYAGSAGAFGPGSFVGGPTGPGSVASASNMSRQGSHSRRGSQTPISPADREFLLGYLNNKIDRNAASGR